MPCFLLFATTPRSLRAPCKSYTHDVSAATPRGHKLWRRPVLRNSSLSRQPNQRVYAGDFWDSEFVQQDFEKLRDDMLTLTPMLHKFPEYDLEGKRLYLERMEDFVERFSVFLTRMRLSEDPMAKAMLRNLNVQQLEANLNLDMMAAGFKQQCDWMRGLLDEEERTTDPARLRMLRAEFAASVGTKPLHLNPTAVDVQNFDSSDLEAITDPKALKAFEEVMENPAALEKYRDDHPALYNLLKKLTMGA